MFIILDLIKEVKYNKSKRGNIIIKYIKGVVDL